MDIDVETAVDISSLSHVSRLLDEEEKTLLSDINEIINKRPEFEYKLSEIRRVLPNFDSLQTNAKKSTNMVSVASKLALDLSGKVRQLDIAQNHVLNCVKKLDDIITLKYCASGACHSLRNGDFEEAAGHIFTFLNLDKDVVDITTKMVSDESEKSPIDILLDCQVRLSNLIIAEFDVAVANKDVKAVENFFKLFRLVGKPDEGLERFGQYICSTISTKCDSLVNMYETTSHQSNNSPWIDLFTEVLDFIAQTIKDNQVCVEKHYGPGNMFHVIQTIQNICDRYAERILGHFRKHHHIEELLQMIKSYNMSSVKSDSTTTHEQTKADRVLAVEQVISELVLLYTHYELYLRFINRRINGDVKQLHLSEAEYNSKVAEVSNFFSKSQLVRKMQDFIGIYISLEGFYLCEMVIKAVNMDEIDDMTKTWRFVDDVFYLLKQSITRALSTGNVDGICAVLNISSTILLDDFINSALTNRVRSGFPSGWMQDAYNYMQSSVAAASSIGAGTSMANTNTMTYISSFGQTGSSSLTRYHFLITINSIEGSINNLQTLTNKLMEEITSAYSSKDTNSEKLTACLNEFRHSNLDKLQRLLDNAFEQLTASVLRGQTKSLLTPFNAMKYHLIEDDLDTFAANDPWIEACISTIDNFLHPFRNVLSTDNNDRLILIFTIELLRRFEQILQRKTYNRFGAVQLDKEFHCLFTYLTSVSYASLRDQFSRLFQICKLLNLDNVEEVAFFWSSSTWRLTPNDVRKILSYRIDFSTDEIRRLKL